MTLQQLHYIVAIDEYRHFGKAAESFGLTQSTLSLMVKKMEEELDVLIFNRDAHPVVPTEIGRKIIDRAKLVLYQIRQIEEMTRSEKDVLSGPLRIALISTVSPVLTPGIFSFFGENYPAITPQIEEMLSDTIRDRLHKAEVDMGILAGPVQDDELLVIPLYHERFFAYVSPANPSFAQDSITRDSLIEQPVWIIRDGMRQIVLKDLKDSDMPYENLFEGGRVGLLVQVVNENGGLTIIPETHTGLILYSQQNCIRPIVNPVPSRTISLAIRKDYIHEAKLNALIKAVKSIVPGELLDNVIRKDHIAL